MKTLVWRASLLAFALLTFALAVGDLALPSNRGTLGLAMRQTRRSTEFTVTQVEPGLPGARAGIREGDDVIPGPGLANWASFLNAVTGDNISLDVYHNGSVRHVTLEAVRSKPDSASSIALLVGFELLRMVMLFVAALIAIRRADRKDARALATFFATFAFIIQGNAWCPAIVAFALSLIAQLAAFVGLQQALVFATIFPYESPGGIRAFLRRAAPYLLSAIVLTWATGMALTIESQALAFNNVMIFVALALVAATATAFISAFPGAPPADRERLRWVSASLLAGFSGFVVTAILEAVSAVQWWTAVPSLTLLAVPVGVTYTLFRHRTFDIGFVISRALTFAILSAIVVLAFSGIEWILAKVVVSAGHVQNVVLDAAFALVLGFSMDRLRGRVDRSVDNIFFRERHRAEDGLRRFSEECAYVTSREVLVERTLDAMERYARADGSALYLLDESGGYCLQGASLAAIPEIDVNDPAVISLRASRRTVDVNDPETPSSSLPGIVAFPMIVRATLTGILCCAARSNGETYDPDERRLIAQLAHSLANAFAAIEAADLKLALNELRLRST